jgi:threonyl-tRNA synthetase
MAMAVQILFPETKVTIGPTTDTGFYYDFDRQQPFTPEDLIKISQQMRLIIKANLPIIREEVNREEIKAEIEQLNEPYKLEILDRIPEGKTITRYYIGSPDGWLCNRSHSPPSSNEKSRVSAVLQGGE